MIIEIQRTVNLKNVKKNIIIKKTVHVKDISNPSQVINSKGKIVKNKCQIHLRNEGLMICNHQYEVMSQLIYDIHLPEIKEVGFFKTEEPKEITKPKRKKKNQ